MWTYIESIFNKLFIPSFLIDEVRYKDEPWLLILNTEFKALFHVFFTIRRVCHNKIVFRHLVILYFLIEVFTLVVNIGIA